MKYFILITTLLSFNAFAGKQWLICDSVEAVCKTRVKTSYNLGIIGKVEKFQNLRKCEKAKRKCNKTINDAAKKLKPKRQPRRF